MRFRRLFLASSCLSSLAFAFALAGCAGSSGSPSSPVFVATPVPTPTPTLAPAAFRGTLDSVTGPIVIAKGAMAADPNSQLISAVGGPPQCDVALYTVTYETIGVNGERANASAGLFLPASGTGCSAAPLPIVAYAHGTNIVKSQLINDPATSNEQLTAPDQLPIVVAAIYASHGYAAIATDYLGLGLSNYPYHPYLHADSEASAVIDSLRAARAATKQLGVALSGDVFISGHSQGGQSAVATQRAIERDEPAEFHVLGDAPSSGPYALSQTFLDAVAHQSQDGPILATFTLVGYQHIYGNVYRAPSDVFLAPYVTGIETLLPVATLQDQIPLGGQTLPADQTKLLQPAFISDFLTNPSNGARADLVKNDLLTGWKPVAPLFLCGGSRDPEVEFANAKAALAYFGSSATLTDVDSFIPASIPITNYHVTVADVCLPLARAKFFDALRSPAAKLRAH